MYKSYRAIIADKDCEALRLIKDYLSQMGHNVVGEANNAHELIQRCSLTQHDLIVTDIELWGMDGLAAVSAINSPVILTAANPEDELIERAANCQIFAILAKPIRERELAATIVITINRFREFQLVKASAFNAHKALEDRKIIERAKGVLMKKREISEQDAFHHLQKLARQHRQKLVDVATSILIAEAAFK